MDNMENNDLFENARDADEKTLKSSNARKDPENWSAGNEEITGAQRSIKQGAE